MPGGAPAGHLHFGEGRAQVDGLITRLREVFPGDRVLTSEAARTRASRDFYWYSPVLLKALEDCLADVVVLPVSEEELRETVRVAVSADVPLTVRGAGTGNYGQAMPLKGGILVDMTQMDAVISVAPGVIRAQAGARMGAMEAAARAAGQGLCVLPSTFERSTVAGFVAGGAGGIGSVTNGWLWDGNVPGARVIEVDAPAGVAELAGDDVRGVIHAYGTTGIVTEVAMALEPAVEWVQLVCSFPTLEHATEFGFAVTLSAGVQRRIVSPSEPGMVAMLNKGMRVFSDVSRAAVCLWVDVASRAEVAKLAAAHHGVVDAELPYGKHPMLSDLGWNHVTLWARKADPAWTYLQTGFDARDWRAQAAAIKARFGDDVLLHFEFVTSQGQVHLAGLSLIRCYDDPGRIPEFVEAFESAGVGVSDPHTCLLEDGGRRNQAWDRIYAAAGRYNPRGLLNPGKMRGTPAPAAR